MMDEGGVEVDGKSDEVMLKVICETDAGGMNHVICVVPSDVLSPDKLSYSEPGAYRPIALLDTITKVLSSCIAKDLTKFSKIHSLLPPNHFSCRPGRTTTDALHYLTSYMKDAWRRNKVVGALFLDIKVPSVILDTLLASMRRRGIPKEYTEWICRKVTNCTTRICFDDFRAPIEAIKRSIDQGCPLSGILFIFYNVDLLEITKKANGEDSIAVVDDITILATGEDLEEAFGKLELCVGTSLSIPNSLTSFLLIRISY